MAALMSACSSPSTTRSPGVLPGAFTGSNRPGRLLFRIHVRSFARAIAQNHASNAPTSRSLGMFLTNPSQVSAARSSASLGGTPAPMKKPIRRGKPSLITAERDSRSPVRHRSTVSWVGGHFPGSGFLAIPGSTPRMLPDWEARFERFDNGQGSYSSSKTVRCDPPDPIRPTA